MFFKITGQLQPPGFGTLFHPSLHDSRIYKCYNYFFDFNHIILFDLRALLNFYWVFDYWVLYFEILIFLPQKLELFQNASCIWLGALNFLFVNHMIHFFLKNQQEGHESIIFLGYMQK